MKKIIQALAALTVLCICLTGCAVKPSSIDSPSPTTSPSLSATTSSKLARSATTSSKLASDYDTVLALKTEGYQSLSLKDFNAAVKAAIDKDTDILSAFSTLMESITPNDEDYQFIYETLDYSISETILPQISQPVSISRYLKKHGDEYTVESGETFYSFIFTALYSVEYRVIDEAGVTVQERDELLNDFHTELQNAVSEMIKEQLTADGIKAELQKIADGLCTKLSTNTLVFENAKIQSIEILEGTQEYQS